LTESAKTSIFDSPLAMRLDSIVDSMVAGGQDGQSSQSEEGLTALDDFFAELG
jgi:hypothetical protein